MCYDRLFFTVQGARSSRGGIIIVEYPSAVHEAPFTEMNRAFNVAFYQLPYDQDAIIATVNMNLSLNTEFTSATPDMSITFTITKGPPKPALVPFIGECAFSQHKDQLLVKLKSEIAAHPEVVLVATVIIEEASPYRSPVLCSAAWETLSKDAEPLSFIDFMAL